MRLKAFRKLQASKELQTNFQEKLTSFGCVLSFKIFFVTFYVKSRHYVIYLDKIHQDLAKSHFHSTKFHNSANKLKVRE